MRFPHFLSVLVPVIVLAAASAVSAQTNEFGVTGTPVLAPDALQNAAFGNKLGANASRSVVPVTDQPGFTQAVQIRVREAGTETNAVQLIAPTSAPVEKGDTLLASLYARGAADKNKPETIAVTFEKNGTPWTKSLFEQTAIPNGKGTWRRILLTFTAAESYRAGEAFAAVRVAFGSQTVELAGLSVLDFGKAMSRDDLQTRVTERTPLGATTVRVDRRDTHQVMQGFGGDYAKAGLGGGQYLQKAQDAVGRATLRLLTPAQARVGIPMKIWAANPGIYPTDDKRIRSVFLLMQDIHRRGIPLAASVWDVPDWMVADPTRKSQRVIPPERYADVIDALARFLVTARDAYGVTVPYISFNEADGGYDVKFTSGEIAAFIKQAAPRFAGLKLKTKWLVGDTSNGQSFATYAAPLLADKSLAPYLGPISFHGWDALGAPDSAYAAIAALGRQYNKPVWCLELGYDAQLWQAKPPVWGTWGNALKLAQAYARVLRVAESSLVDYWEYQEDYPLAGGPNGDQPYPALHIIQQIKDTLPPGAQIVSATSDNADIIPIAAATHGPKNNGLHLLLVDLGGAGAVSLTGLPPGARLTITRSDATGQNRRDPSPVTVSKDGTLIVPLTGRSVVTLTGD